MTRFNGLLSADRRTPTQTRHHKVHPQPFVYPIPYNQYSISRSSKSRNKSPVALLLKLANIEQQKWHKIRIKINCHDCDGNASILSIRAVHIDSSWQLLVEELLGIAGL